MVSDAEAHAEEDKQRREEADVRNQAESTVYQAEKFVSENGENIADDKKETVNNAVAEVRTALEGSDLEAIKSAVEKVNTELQAIGTAMYEQQAAQADGAGEAEEDGVVDAEVVDDDDTTSGDDSAKESK